MASNYCVYQHTSPSGKVYIGITNNVKRRWGCNGIHYMNKRKNGQFVQQSFARALLKYGWINFKHEILFDNLSKEEAQAREIELIASYKKQGLSYNIANGGEGVSGIKHPPLSEERRAQISAFMKEHHPMKGKHHTEEAREKISQAGKGRKMPEEWCRKLSERMTGKPLSEAAKQKLREHKKAHPEEWIGGQNALEVHQYDLNGNYLKSYKSFDAAAIAICGKHHGDKIGRIFKGTAYSAFGYFWSLTKVEQYDVTPYKIVNTKHGVRVYLINTTEKQ